MINPHPQPEVLALFESGDLPLKQARRIELHIAGCAECSVTRSDLAATRDLLRTSLPEPSTGDLVALRSCVLQSLDRERARPSDSYTFHWLTATAAAATLALTLIPLWHRGPAPVLQSPTVSTLTPLPLAEPTLPEPVLVPMHRSHIAHRAVARRKAGMRDAAVLLAADGSAHLRIRTTDPNVVILLPISENTHEETN